MSKKNPDKVRAPKNLKISSICEGVIVRNESIAALFNEKATPAEKAAVKKASFDVLNASFATAAADTSELKKAESANLVDALLKRAEVVATVVVREEGEEAVSQLAQAFATMFKHPLVGGKNYDKALDKASAPTLANIAKRAYELNKAA